MQQYLTCRLPAKWFIRWVALLFPKYSVGRHVSCFHVAVYLPHSTILLVNGVLKMTSRMIRTNRKSIFFFASLLHCVLCLLFDQFVFGTMGVGAYCGRVAIPTHVHTLMIHTDPPARPPPRFLQWGLPEQTRRTSPSRGKGCTSRPGRDQMGKLPCAPSSPKGFTEWALP